MGLLIVGLMWVCSPFAAMVCSLFAAMMCSPFAVVGVLAVCCHGFAMGVLVVVCSLWIWVAMGLGCAHRGGDRG